VKLAIIVGAFYFIYNKIVHNEHLEFSVFAEQLESNIFNNYGVLITLILFTLLNWFFEILKWEVLASFCRSISFFESAKQSFSSLTASLFTPNRIGEYGAKAIYFSKGSRRKIMLLNLLSNINQMSTTVLFGSFGIYYFLNHFPVEIDGFSLRKLVYVAAILIAFVFFGKKYGFKKIRGFYIDKIISFTKSIPIKIHVVTFLFSCIRYLIFSHQFYFLLYTFNINIDYTTAMALISSMYLIASLVPSLAFFDWLIKGTVAVWVFSFIGADELIIITITLFMWVLNFGFPAIIGSYFVMNFSFSNQK
jgi:hypothetical protein